MTKDKGQKKKEILVMSSPALPRSPSPANPMRQQLDELDDLLQRMLSLPVNQVDDAVEVTLPQSSTPAAAERRKTQPALSQLAPVEEKEKKHLPAANIERQQSPVIRSEPATKLRGPSLFFQPIHAPDILTAAAPPPAEETAPFEKSMPDVNLPAPPGTGVPEPTTVRGWGPAQSTLPIQAPEEPAVDNVPSLPEPRSPFLERHQARLRKRRQAAPALRPVVWINHAFDRCAVAFGRPGLWLIKPETRAVFGWLGLGLLIAAAVILVGDWLGWSWPN
jgi:hypothetical protein